MGRESGGIPSPAHVSTQRQSPAQMEILVGGTAAAAKKWHAPIEEANQTSAAPVGTGCKGVEIYEIAKYCPRFLGLYQYMENIGQGHTDSPTAVTRACTGKL